MQSKNDEKDKEVVERVNELIRDPDANMNAASDLDEPSSHAELMRLLNGVESQGKHTTEMRFTCVLTVCVRFRSQHYAREPLAVLE